MEVCHSWSPLFDLWDASPSVRPCLGAAQYNWHRSPVVICPRGPRHGNVSSLPSLSTPRHPPSLSAPFASSICLYLFPCLLAEQWAMWPPASGKQGFQGLGGDIRLLLQWSSRLPPSRPLWRQALQYAAKKYIYICSLIWTHVQLCINRHLNTRRWVHTSSICQDAARITHWLRCECSHMYAHSRTRLSAMYALKHWMWTCLNTNKQKLMLTYMLTIKVGLTRIPAWI